MLRNALSFAATLLLAATGIHAAEWNGFESRSFTLPSGASGNLVVPKSPAADAPWILVSDLYRDIPATAAMRALLSTMVDKGWHVLSAPLGNTFGAPAALQIWDEAYSYGVNVAHLAKRPALIGLSREGLAIHRWAAWHPQQVSAIYGDRAVCDFKSWPAGKAGAVGKGSTENWEALMRAYGFQSEAQALAYRENPTDLAPALAASQIQILEVVGEKDDVVPPAENAVALQKRMKAAGSNLQLLTVAGAGHQPHGPPDPKIVVDFLVRTAQESVIDEKFQQWKSGLTQDQQQWEKKLEANLGSFYLPIYKREKTQGKETAWDYVSDQPGLPRVLLIGDSVSRGYTLPVRHALEGKVNLHRAPENCGSSANGLKKLDIYLEGGHWDVIHFNFGLHDLNVAPEVYERNLRAMVARLRQTDAILIWARTTPLPPGDPRKFDQERLVQANQTADKVMNENGIAIDDLYGAILPRQKELQNPSDVHFTNAGYDFLGAQVSRALMDALKQGRH